MSATKFAFLRILTAAVGSGCGLGGFSFVLRGAHVTLTDVEEMMPLLKANLAANFSVDEIKERHTRVLPFSWGSDPEAAQLTPPYDWIIGADIVYKVFCTADVRAPNCGLIHFEFSRRLI